MSAPTRRQAAVEFFFDSGCPWSYLALGRLREAAIRTGSRIIFRPVLVDEVLASANPGFPADRIDPVPARARYAAKDLMDWARFCGVEIRRPQPWPVRTEWAQRGALAADEAGLVVPYLSAIFAAFFAENRQIAELSVVTAIAGAAGMDTGNFSARVREADTLAALRANAGALLLRGGFGTPTMLIGDDLYFGNDRMPLVEAALARAADMRLVLPGEHGT